MKIQIWSFSMSYQQSYNSEIAFFFVKETLFKPHCTSFDLVTSKSKFLLIRTATLCTFTNETARFNEDTRKLSKKPPHQI